MVLVLPPGSALLLEWLAGRRLAHELALCRDAGMASVPDDLRRNPPADSDNAADLYRQAIKQYRAIDGPDVDFVKGYFFSTKEDLKRILGERYKGGFSIGDLKANFEKLSPVLKLVDRAVQLKHLRFPRKWEDGGLVQLPEYSYLERIAHLMWVRALLSAEAGKPREAVAALQTARTMAYHCFEEPTLMAQLAGRAILFGVDSTAVRLVMRHPGDSKLAERLRAFLSEPQHMPHMRDALDSEAYLGNVLLDQVAENPKLFEPNSEDYFDYEDKKYARFSLIRRSWQAVALRRYREAYVALPKDPDDWRESKRVFLEMVQKFEDDSSLLAKLIHSQEFSFMKDFYESILRHHRLAIVATLVLEERNRTGRLPLILPVVADGRDPLTGARYKLTATKDNGFMVYVPDKNGVDHGGDAYQDIGIAVEKDHVYYGDAR